MQRILCLTNTVAANFTANALLAVGATPAMVEEPDEAAELASASDAVLINVGTVTSTQAVAMRAAIAACNARHVPWVLDPVAVQALSFRRALVTEFLALNPSAIRGNRAEIDFLRSFLPTQMGPVPTQMGSVPTQMGSVPTQMGSVPTLATGVVDRVYDGAGGVREISGGVPMLQQVTATGCAQGAIVAAFLGRGQTPVEALLSASTLMKRAGERAAACASAPGSFQIALLDALWEMTK